jgi:hypothetical protein
MSRVISGDLAVAFSSQYCALDAISGSDLRNLTASFFERVVSLCIPPETFLPFSQSIRIAASFQPMPLIAAEGNDEKASFNSAINIGSGSADHWVFVAVERPGGRRRGTRPVEQPHGAPCFIEG